MDITSVILQILRNTWILEIADVLMAVQLFISISTNPHKFAQSFPIASFHIFMGSKIFGKAILSFLVGKPILGSFPNVTWMLLNASIWYLSLFTPNNYFMKLITLPYFKLPTSALKEVHRVYSVVNVVSTLLAYNAGGYFSTFLFSSIIASSFRMVIIPFEQLYRGVVVSDHELKYPGLTTKLGSFVSFIYVSYCYAKAGFFPSFSNVLFWITERIVVNSLICLCIACQFSDYFCGKDPVSKFMAILGDLVFSHRICLPNFNILSTKRSTAPTKRQSRQELLEDDKPQSKASSPVQRRRRTSKG